MSALPKLDTEKFAKVLRLVNDGATDGERKAARAIAEAIARRAGMTFHEAASTLDAHATQPTPFNVFDEFFKSPEMQAHRSAKQCTPTVSNWWTRLLARLAA